MSTKRTPRLYAQFLAACGAFRATAAQLLGHPHAEVGRNVCPACLHLRGRYHRLNGGAACVVELKHQAAGGWW